MGSCMLDLGQRLFTLIGALWLIGDLISDIANTKQYHDMATELNGNIPFYSQYEFLRNENDSSVILKESCFFYASASALVLPIPVGLVLVLIFFLCDYSRNLKRWLTGCCSNKCCGNFCGISLSIIFLPITFIIAITVSILIVPIAWIFSPFLHISRALFALFGAKPAGESSIGAQRKSFKRFWTFVLLLGVMEQVLEALPQTIISGLFFYLEQRESLESIDVWDLAPHLYENHKTQVISFIFSAGSLLLFMAVNIFQYTNDYPNSFFGLINSLVKESNAKKKYSDTNKNIEETLQLNFTSYSIEEENNSKCGKKEKQNPTSEEETSLLGMPEIIDAEQEKWLKGVKTKDNIQNKQEKNQQTASLCIKGGVSALKQLELVNFLIEHGVPQNFALKGRFDNDNCDFFVDNLEINFCAELVKNLNGLYFEEQRLKCTGIITAMEGLSTQAQVDIVNQANPIQHIDEDQIVEEINDEGLEAKSRNLRPGESNNENQNPNEVLDGSTLPFMEKVKNRGGTFMKQLKFKKSRKSYSSINNDAETNHKVDKETDNDSEYIEAKNDISKESVENDENNTSEKGEEIIEDEILSSTSKY